MRRGVVDTPARWFALQVKPKHEKSVTAALRSKGLREFLPLYKARRRWSDRIQEVYLPLFRGYTFCWFDPGNRVPVLQTPGVTRIVGFGGIPVPVEDEEIVALQAIVQSGLPAVPHPFLRVGQRVRIQSGPLSGLLGIIETFRGSHRLVVSVTLLQRAVAVEMRQEWVMPAA